MTMDRKNQLATMPSSYRTCRVVVGNHTPDPAVPPRIYNAPGGGYTIEYTCAFCKAEITKERDRHGFVTDRRSYKYQDGYLMQEGGRLTASEKAALFLDEAGLFAPAKPKANRKDRRS